MREFFYYVGGEFKKSNNKLEVINPANEEVFAEIFEAEEKDLYFALQKAKEAQVIWQKTSFQERAKLLKEINQVILGNLKELAELETQEIGKPLKESLFVDIPLGAEVFNYYASFLETYQEEFFKEKNNIDYISYLPFGVCGFYLPYNVPLMIFGFNCAPSLAAGNAIVIKPSEYGSLSLLRLIKDLDKLDFPKGLINVITGRGETIGKMLAESEIDLISFTGSRETLKKIITASSNYPKKIIAELGGCNLAVVFRDIAFLEDVLENILGSSFIKAGQMCIGLSLVLVEDKIYKDFVKKLVEKTKKIVLGDPFDPQTGMGPLANKFQLEKIKRKVDELLKKGAKLLCGGKHLDKKGYFYLPTILETEEIFYEELFGPVIMVKSFKENEIEEIIHKNPTGLLLQIWTDDLKKAELLSRKANYGTVWINTFGQMSSKTSFGGVKQSGWGRNLGRAGFLEYCQIKHIGIGFEKSPIIGWFG